MDVGPLVFAPPGTQPLAEQVARALGVQLAPLELRRFGAGEFKIRPLVPVRSRRTCIIHSLHGPAGSGACERLCELLFLAGALHDAGAERVCAVVPYMAFARKDRRTKPQDPVSFRYVAQMMEAIGIDRVVAIEAHNPAAFDNAFRIRSEHLAAAPLFAAHVGSWRPLPPLAVVSPDLGGAKGAQLLREALQEQLGVEVEFGCVEKRRSSGVVSGHYFAGDVAGRAVILIDDLISSGGTLRRAAQRCREAGAIAVHAMATHAPLDADAPGVLSDPVFDSLVVTDTVPVDPALASALAPRLTVLPVAGLLAAAIAADAR